MNDEKDTIFFTLEYEGENFRIQAHRNQYHSLMTLISCRLGIPGFGLCSGMGSCGTCLVSIREKNSAVEIHTLSCGVQVDDELSGKLIVVG